MNTPQQTPDPGTRAADQTANLNYMAATVEHSLYRNGKLLTRRDPDGSDGDIIGMAVDKRRLPIRDARQLSGSAACTLNKNGFEVLASALDDAHRNFLSHEAVTRTYYPQCEEIVRLATGARTVAAFDHNVRSASGKQSRTRIDGGQQVQGPARIVHGDYTLTSAPQRLRDLTQPAGGNDTLRTALSDGQPLLDAELVRQVLTDGRYAIINVWRNIAPEPVVTHPLALCDGKSVVPQDLAVFEIHYQDRIGENYFARFSPAHRWFCYPRLTRDEALLIKQWDSAGPLAQSAGAVSDGSAADAPCTFSFHSAFRDPTTPHDAPERWSIEVRCVVIY